MTTEAKNANELIRYPVAVMAGCPWNILDAAGMRIAMCGDPGKLGYNHTDTLRAAEIVRALNAYHAIESKPAPVEASGEPSGAAMRASREIDGSDNSKPPSPWVREIARIIDDAFAAERAEAAEQLERLREIQVDLNGDCEKAWGKFREAERERDEARAEAKCLTKRSSDYHDAWKSVTAFIKELEADLAVSYKLREQAEISAMSNRKEHAQLRADLDEAVVILKNWVSASTVSIYARRTQIFLDRLSKPSEPGNCSELPAQAPCASVDTPCAPPETATESGDAYVGWHDRRDELGRRVRDTWVRWAQDQLYTKPSWVIPYDEISEADKEVDRQIGEDIAVFVELQAQATIATLRQQLAERDAEIERLNSVLAGVRELIHSSGA